MKTIFMALTFLVFSLGNTTAQDSFMSSSYGPMTVRQLLKEIHNSILDDNVEIPIGPIAKMIADNMPCMDPIEFIMDKYSAVCGYSNCDMDARKCHQALRPAKGDLCQAQKICVQDALNGITEGVNPKLVMEECFIVQMMAAMDLPYSPDASLESNVQDIIDALVSNSTLPMSVQDAVMVAAGTLCKIPPRGSCITDHIRFKICLTNTCVASMYESTRQF